MSDSYVLLYPIWFSPLFGIAIFIIWMMRWNRASKIGVIHCKKCGYTGKAKALGAVWSDTYGCPHCRSTDWESIDDIQSRVQDSGSSMSMTPGNIDDLTKKCPACAETIKLEAKKCRFCGEVFDPAEVEKEVAAAKEAQDRLNERSAQAERERRTKLKAGLKECPTCGNWDVFSAADGQGGTCDWCPHCNQPVERGWIQVTRQIFDEQVQESTGTEGPNEPYVTAADKEPEEKKPVFEITEDGCCPICPKCGYERKPKDDEFVSRTECPRCGVIYAKFLDKQKETNLTSENQIGKDIGEINTLKQMSHALLEGVRYHGKLVTLLAIILLLVCTLSMFRKGTSPSLPLNSSILESDLFLIRYNGKYGYMDKSGNVVISPQYDNGGAFREGLATVRLNDVWGFIDQSGQIVISPRYQETGGFFDGLAAVKLNGMWGFINPKGEVQIGLQFDNASRFYDGISSVTVNDKFGLINKKGEYIVKPMYEDARAPRDGVIPVRHNGKWGYICSNGQMLIKPQFDSVYQSFVEGLSCAGINGKVGYIDKTGKYVIQPQYTTGSRFNDGIAGVCSDDTCHFINVKGQSISSNYNDMGTGFSEGMARVKVNNEWGYINKEGKMVIKPIFDSAQEFSNGLARVLTNSLIQKEVSLEDKDDHDLKWRWSYIDTAGNVVWTEDADFLPRDYVFSEYWDDAVKKAKDKSNKFAVCSDGFEHDFSVIMNILSLKDSDIQRMTVPELYKTLVLIDGYSNCLTLHEASKLTQLNLSKNTIDSVRRMRQAVILSISSLITELNKRGYDYKHFELVKSGNVPKKTALLPNDHLTNVRNTSAKSAEYNSNVDRRTENVPKQQRIYEIKNSTFAGQEYGNWSTFDDDAFLLKCRTDYTPEWKWHNISLPDHPNLRIALVCFEHECGAAWKDIVVVDSSGEITITGEIARDQSFSHVDIVVNDKWDGVSKELYGTMFQLQDGRVKIDVRDSSRFMCLKDDNGSFAVNKSNVWYPFELKYSQNGKHMFKIKSNSVWHSLEL